MFELVADFDADSPEGRAALRRHLAACQLETYPRQVGRRAAEVMAARFDSEDLGGFFKPQTRVVVFRREGEILACCFHGPREEGVAWFWGLYVRESAQRQGLARRMLREVLRAWPQVAILRATVLRASPEALRFYNALEFAAVGEGAYELAPGRIERALLLEWDFKDRAPPFWAAEA